MTIAFLGGPSPTYIKNLIENNLSAFGNATTVVIENDDDELISDAIAYLIENNQSVFTQVLADMITANINNYFSQSISTVIRDYHEQFEAPLTPALEGSAPVSFTDFTNRAYWTPINCNYWNITWPVGGGIRLETDVTAQSNIPFTSCGVRFRCGIYRDVSTKQFVARLKITNIHTGNPTSAGSTNRHLVGLVVTTQDAAYLFGVGRNGNTISGVTGSALVRNLYVPYESFNYSTGITSELSGDEWEVRIIYAYDTSANRAKIKGDVRVDGGDWIALSDAATHYSHCQVDGITIGAMAACVNDMYPDFGGTITEFAIDEGRFVSF